MVIKSCSLLFLAQVISQLSLSDHTSIHFHEDVVIVAVVVRIICFLVLCVDLLTLVCTFHWPI